MQIRSSVRSATLITFVLALASLGGCASMGTRLEPPDVTLVRITPLASTALEQRFEVEVRIVNPNDVPLAGDGLDVTIELNGKRLTRALSPDTFTIPRLSDDTVTLTGTTTLFDLFRQAVALPEDGRLDYRLVGRVSLADSIGWLRFTREGSLLPEDAGL
ncbi:MAG: LEA type 2 family protein [Myxococcota bacterium]